MKIHATMLPQSLQCFMAHATFSDNGPHAESANDLCLVRFLPTRRCWTGSNNLPSTVVAANRDRAAMVNDTVAQVRFRWQITTGCEMLVDSVARCENNTGNYNPVADVQFSDAFLVQRCL